VRLRHHNICDLGVVADENTQAALLVALADCVCCKDNLGGFGSPEQDSLPSEEGGWTI
jgi:hypothetical protein